MKLNRISGSYITSYFFDLGGSLLNHFILCYTIHKPTYILLLTKWYTIYRSNTGKALRALLTVPKVSPFILILIKRGLKEID